METENKLPMTDAGTVAFLAGRRVEGIGPAFARKLVEAFGTAAPDILLNDPKKAETVPGLGPAKVATARESLEKIASQIEFIQFLYSCGISEMMVDKILGKYRKRAKEIATKDPYSMVEDVWRLGFFTADKIGKRLGVPADDPRRIEGALVTAVKQYAEAGHLFATVDEAAAAAARLAGITPDKVKELIPKIAEGNRIVMSKGGLYLPVFYNAEKAAAEKLVNLSKSPVAEDITIEEIPDTNSEGIPYSEAQKEAILKALNSNVMVLTGGPGTGKTTVLRGVIDVLKGKGKKVVLAAPTGRAAKRMSTLTGEEATTIHRLLGYREGQGWLHRPIEADVLIIDEGSMMEQVLFDHILQCVSPGTRIILVGDADQLPAIGAGDVLRDMIKSDVVSVSRLEENFRQGAASGIAAGAREINRGQVPSAEPSGDLMIVEEETVKGIHDRIISLMTRELPESRGIKPTDIQVVSPQQIGPLGARQLNHDLQAIINPEGEALKRGMTLFRVGDPVMQTANSRERGIYNGEIGHISSVNPDEQTLTVEFSDGRKSVYARNELSELVLAYATSVHKLQGSEVKYMIFPITMAHKPMLYRNLLYTGVSRASNLCVLVGEEEALRYAVGNTPATTRNSNFAERLKEASENLEG